MSRRQRTLLRVEHLNSRLTPAVTRSIGTFEITDVTVTPNHTWASTDTDANNNVISTDTLEGTLDVTYTLSDKELARARTAGAGWIVDDEIRWREDDAPDGDDDVASAFASYRINLGPAATSATVVYAPASFTTTNGANTGGLEGSRAEYYGWMNKTGSLLNYKTGLVYLENWTSVGGGANRNKRVQTAGVGIATGDTIPSPSMPALLAGGYYRVLTFDSPNGTDFTFTAGNSADYGLFAASSAALVQDADGEAVLDPDATLNPVFLGDTGTAGTYNGTNDDLVLRATTGGEAQILSGHSYSATPAALLSLADGQSVNIDGEDVEEGDEMLWLAYEAGDDSYGFVLIPTTSSDPTLTVSDVAVTEGDSGTTNATFTVSQSAASASTVTVGYATAGGTATSGTDFTPPAAP